MRFRRVKYILCGVVLAVSVAVSGCNFGGNVQENPPHVTGQVTPQEGQKPSVTPDGGELPSVTPDGEQKPSVTPQVSQNPTNTPEASPELTVTPTQPPRNLNPLKMQGYQQKQKEAVDEANHVRLLATLESEVKLNGQIVSEIGILSYDEEHILVKYTVAPSREALANAVDCTQHLSLFDTKTLKLEKEIKLDGHFYIQRTEKVIGFETHNGSMSILETYDYELNKIGRFGIENEMSKVFTEDGKRCYYTKNKSIYVMDSKTGGSELVEVKAEIHASFIHGVVTNASGIDYLVVGAMAADYNNYEFIINARSGDVQRVSKMDERYSVVSNNTYMEFIMGNMYPEQWLLGISKKEAYDYKWNGVGVELGTYVLKNKDILFVYAIDNCMYLFLFEYESGKLMASTSFDVSSMRAEGYLEGVGGIDPGWDTGGVQVFLYDLPIYMNEDTILLQMSNYGNEQFFLEWNLELDEASALDMQVTKHEMGTSPGIDISEFGDTLYTPGELSEHLAPLRERADEMEAKYGVDIFIGEECANVLGGYSIKPLLDYYMLDRAMDVLEVQMDKYPDNFFTQFEYSWVKGVDIYLASTLSGVSGDVLDYAGGFKTVEGENVLLVLDCTDIQGMPSTFHHELCHVIEEKIVEHSYTQDAPVFTEEDWNALNPHDNMYTYTYADRGLLDYVQYVYEERLGKDGKIEDTYFVDTYAMTYPTEDRARLFECVMSTELFDVSFENAPHLVEKLNYYAVCIRDAFDTTGWENVPWEAYME